MRPASAARQRILNANAAIPILRVRVGRLEKALMKDSETGQVHVLHTKGSAFRFVPVSQLECVDLMKRRQLVTTRHHLLTNGPQTASLGV